MTKTCEGCGHAFDERQMFQMITAWVATANRSRQVGKRYEQRFACRPCVEAFTKSGTTWKQEALF
jgi:hypothetical protein